MSKTESSKNIYPPPAHEDDRLLWQVDLARRYGFDRVTIYRWDVEGRLPRPDVIFGRRRGWYERTIRQWEAASRESRDSAAG